MLVGKILYASVLQITAIYLAFQIRKVKVKGVNDAKYTAVVVCITTIVLIVFLILTLVLFLINYIDTYSVIVGAFLWIFATTVLGFMFVPKVK